METPIAFITVLITIGVLQSRVTAISTRRCPLPLHSPNADLGRDHDLRGARVLQKRGYFDDLDEYKVASIFGFDNDAASSISAYSPNTHGVPDTMHNLMRYGRRR